MRNWRATVIAAPPATVFTLVNSYKRFNEWSPWAEMDPNAAYTHSGPETGVGAKLTTGGTTSAGSDDLKLIITSATIV